MTITPKLTHEQAALLRACDLVEVHFDQLIEGWWELERQGWIKRDYEPSTHGAKYFAQITAIGKAALDEYDAHYTMVETAELERLRALERKIEAFLNAIDLRVYEGAIEFNFFQEDCTWIKVFQMGGFWHTRLSANAPYEFLSCSDAMCKAFELFEVPGVEVKS